MRRVEIGQHKTDYYVDMLLVIEDRTKFVCINLQGDLVVYKKEYYKYRFLDPPEEENEKFGNPEFVKTEKLRLDNAHAKIHNLTTEVDALKERTQSLENLNKSRSMLEKLKGEPERVVGNPDEPQPTFTRDEIGKAFDAFMHKINTGVYGTNTPLNSNSFLPELDKVKNGI